MTAIGRRVCVETETDRKPEDIRTDSGDRMEPFEPFWPQIKSSPIDQYFQQRYQVLAPIVRQIMVCGI